ncbi:MAG: hypothetical protein QOK02_2408, partial [Mycobacterium sp.]|nr:hypothetical protein [Mycobacterium sp.]
GLTPGTWTIDPVHSSITFSVRHLMVGRVRGRFGDFCGAITVPENGTPSITATIAVGSVDTGNPTRDGLAGGGPMVGDTVDVTVCLEAVKAPAAPTG